MNISSLMRNLIGDAQVSDAKALELKVGQIVKGVILQLMNDGDALLNINGVQVRAKLETPMQAGDVTYLQVQPESKTGLIVMKALGLSEGVASSVQLADFLQAFGMKNTQDNRTLLLTMQGQGVPLTKENAAEFAAISADVPEGVDAKAWIQAAAILVKRGLPLTADSVKSVHAALANPSVITALDKLQLEIAAFSNSDSQLKEPTAQLLTKLTAQIKDAEALMNTMQQLVIDRQPEVSKFSDIAGQVNLAEKDSEGSAAQNGNVVKSPNVEIDEPLKLGETRQASSQAESQALPQAQVQDPKQTQARTQPMPLSQPNSNQPMDAVDHSLNSNGQGTDAAETASAALVSSKADSLNLKNGSGSSTSHELPSMNEDESSLSRLFKLLGVEHEHHAAKLVAKLEGSMRSTDMDLGALPVGDAALASSKGELDNLKGSLMTLAASDGIPASLKETAQSVINQITGQQLLLSQDRSTMFSHITMFVPFKDGNGNQSAAVHISSRKGRNGALDANNCRLVFDLHMKALGDTLVDVHVVDRIVSLHVSNDEPLVEGLLEGNREEISAALQKLGYHFISMKCTPFPEIQSQSTGQTPSSGGNTLLGANRELYEPKPYKGVDLRV